MQPIDGHKSVEMQSERWIFQGENVMEGYRYISLTTGELCHSVLEILRVFLEELVVYHIFNLRWITMKKYHQIGGF